MNVFKFGGASVKDAPGFANVASIMRHFSKQKLAIVVSAIGKTTNALEEVVKAYYSGQGSEQALLEGVKKAHLDIIAALEIKDSDLLSDLNDLFVEIEWVIDSPPQDVFDYVYDQVVSVGELLSSKILYYYLKQNGHNAAWLDIRGVLFTDEVHREAKVNWKLSTEKINTTISTLMQSHDVVITQGFIGSTTENHTTTLGREGSDYTAAILSYCCDAEAMHIWKDVPGVLTADPKKFTNVSMIEKLSYTEAIEMTYYGAKVIHPKTIKPLQNKNIPLYVRPFDNPTSLGTKISSESEIIYPPIVVIEDNQALIGISVKDFSFVAEHHISNIFALLSQLRLKVNMMRNSAISFTLCVQYNEEKIKALAAMLNDEFTLSIEKNLEIITIRHATPEIIAEMKRSRLTLMEDMLNDAVQFVVKTVPTMSRIG